MGIQTRSSTSNSPVKSKTPMKVVLPIAGEEPYKIFVLPSNASKDARIVLLENPRDGASRQYYFSPCQGLFEITKISATGVDCRSILLAPDNEETSSVSEEKVDDPKTAEMADGSVLSRNSVNSQICNGHVNKSAEILVATPFDPAFILLPLLDRPKSNERARPGPGVFQPLDDLLDGHLDHCEDLRYVLTNPTFRPKLLDAMNQLCDSIVAGDEQMYRLDMLKVYEYLVQKAQRVVKQGLPASLEERFVIRSLDIPMLSVKREEATVPVATENSEFISGCARPDLSESQPSTTSPLASTALSKASSVTSIEMVDETASANIQDLQRLRTAMSFITASYLDPSFAERLSEASRDSKVLPSFGPLDEHLQKLAKSRAEAIAARSLSDFSKKREHEDDEAAEGRAEKRRKQEEEDKRKKNQESRGVRDLKKVNVSGMKKMNDFFTKKAPTAKPIS